MASLPHSDTTLFLRHILSPSLGVLAFHSLFLYLDPPPPIPPPSDWLRLFSSQTVFCINTPTILSRLFFLLTLLMKMEQIECSETTSHKFTHRGITRKNTTFRTRWKCEIKKAVKVYLALYIFVEILTDGGCDVWNMLQDNCVKLSVFTINALCLTVIIC